MHGLMEGAAERDEVVRMPPSTGGCRLTGLDAAVVWGWRRGSAMRAYNPDLPILVMERGYVGDRFKWTSLGWNGLNGHAVFPAVSNFETQPNKLRRWVDTVKGDSYWQPWRKRASSDYALILGQVPSDMACRNVNLAHEYRRWQSQLLNDGWEVKFRPHPKAARRPLGISSMHYLQGTLAQDLAGAAFTVSWNSNASVDSVLAGVPSVTLDKGAMAWAVTSHDLSNPVTMPSRTEWAAQLAWCQWQPSELSDGTAWTAVKEAMPK
jgi:hypothetical protein